MKISLLLFVSLSLTSYCWTQIPTVGTTVQGDFNGDGKKEFAFPVQTIVGQGNPMEDGTSDEYEIQFTELQLKTIVTGCCTMQFINEGDLNEDGGDELSVYQAPMNGNTFSMTTYTYSKGSWKELIKTFLIPTGGDYLDNQQIQDIIWKENGVVYYNEVDPNDENFRLIQKKAILE